MFRRFTIFFSADFVLDNRRLWGPNETTPPDRTSTHRQQQLPQLKDGQYPVQQATFNDGGEYSLILLNTRHPPTFRTTNLQMARLTDEEIKAGQKNLKVENGQPALYLTEDFKIEYVHCYTDPD